MEHQTGSGVLILLMSVAGVLGADPVELAVSNIKQETIDQPATLDRGRVPCWLNGDFVRHSCGAFGETKYQTPAEPNYIEHMFDCIGIGSKFRLEGGQVTFTNRWYDTTVNEVYNTYDRNMNKSSVFFPCVFSSMNGTQLDKWKGNMTDEGKVDEVPHVSWWTIDGKAIAMSETPIGVVVDPHTMSQQGYAPYQDNDFNLSMPVQNYVNNPAHEHIEPDGTLWSTVTAVSFTSRTTFKQKRLIYKVGSDFVRHVVGEYAYADADLTRCQGNDPYPDMEARFGNLHSFSMTENYIILPEGAYVHDPCFYARYSDKLPYFLQAFKFEPSGFSRLLVMRKSDGVIVANIKSKPFFATHQLGAYEEGGIIKMHMIMYDNADVYTKITYTNYILQGDEFSSNVTAIHIDTSDWSVSYRNIYQGAPESYEMPTINYAFNAMKYQYAYMVKGFNSRLQNALTKLHVDTGEMKHYEFPNGLLVMEPQFIPRPGATEEDDGVLMAHGIDGNKEKAFLVILDAKNMTLIAHLTAPDLALTGLHGKFYPIEAGECLEINGASGLRTSYVIKTVVPVVQLILIYLFYWN